MPQKRIFHDLCTCKTSLYHMSGLHIDDFVYNFYFLYLDNKHDFIYKQPLYCINTSMGITFLGKYVSN